MLALQDAPVPDYSAAAIRPAVGSLADGFRPAAAPLGEAAPRVRSQVAKPPRQLVVLGRNAQASVDDRVLAAYRTDLAGRHVETVECTDREVVELLMLGRADFGLIGGQLSQREIHAGLRQTRLGVELFALTVPPTSSVRSLTRTQVREVFTGQVTDWRELGFPAGPITPIVPVDQRTAERAAKVLMPGDAFADSCARVASERDVVERLASDPGAIGIVRVTAQPRAPGQKLIQIDWTPATPEAFGYGSYPYGVPLQLITSGRPDDDARAFLDFANGEDGLRLLGRTLTFVR